MQTFSKRVAVQYGFILGAIQIESKDLINYITSTLPLKEQNQT